MIPFQSFCSILLTKHPIKAGAASLLMAAPTYLELQFSDNKEYNQDVSYLVYYNKLIFNGADAIGG